MTFTATTIGPSKCRKRGRMTFDLFDISWLRETAIGHLVTATVACSASVPGYDGFRHGINQMFRWHPSSSTAQATYSCSDLLESQPRESTKHGRWPFPGITFRSGACFLDCPKPTPSARHRSVLLSVYLIKESDREPLPWRAPC